MQARDYVRAVEIDADCARMGKPPQPNGCNSVKLDLHARRKMASFCAKIEKRLDIVFFGEFAEKVGLRRLPSVRAEYRDMSAQGTHG